jgi:hypothetical protein
MTLTAHWVDRARDPKNAPDPAFPLGIDLDMSEGAKVSCWTALPYPARRCGYYVILCDECGLKALATTAGRPDDPRSVRLACKRP